MVCKHVWHFSSFYKYCINFCIIIDLIQIGFEETLYTVNESTKVVEINAEASKEAPRPFTVFLHSRDETAGIYIHGSTL